MTINAGSRWHLNKRDRRSKTTRTYYQVVSVNEQAVTLNRINRWNAKLDKSNGAIWSQSVESFESDVAMGLWKQYVID